MDSNGKCRKYTHPHQTIRLKRMVSIIFHEFHFMGIFF